MNKIIYIIIAVLILGGVGWLILRNNSNNNSTMNETTTQDKVEEQTSTGTTTPEETPAVAGKFVTLDVKGYGKIKIELNTEKAPKSSANFAKLASEKFYDGLTFHRIIDGFVVQGGDPDGTGAGGPGYTVPAEIGLLHKKGSVAMARQADQVNPTRASSGSQFYIALQDLPMLDGQYTVFGQVVEGMDIVDKLGKVETGPGDMPLTPITIISATVSDK